MPQSGPPPQSNKGELCLSVLFLLPVTKFHAYTHPWWKKSLSPLFILILMFICLFGMLSRSLSDFQSPTFNIMIWVSNLSEVVNCVTKSLNQCLSMSLYCIFAVNFGDECCRLTVTCTHEVLILSVYNGCAILFWRIFHWACLCLCLCLLVGYAMSPDPSDQLSCQRGQVSKTVLQCSEDAEIKSQRVSQSVTVLLNKVTNWAVLAN